MAVSVLVLQTFSGQSGAAGSSTEKEAARAHVGGGPDEIGNALETEHGIINKERDGVDAVSGIGGACGDKGGHGAGFGNSLFEDLSVLGFLVIEQSVHIDGLIALADAGVDAHGAE